MNGSKDKIRPLEEVARLVAEAKAQGLRVAQCHGVFDLLHPGHVRHLEAARRMADLLVVTLPSDKDVHLGPGRPVFNQRLRAETIAALESVRFVSVAEGAAAAAIRTVKPHLFVQGGDCADDPEGGPSEEESAVRSVGGEIRFTDEIIFSSTSLLNSYFDVYSSEAEQYLSEFRRRWPAERVLAEFEKLKELRVTVVGDVIIDEYHYCKAIGKSSKSANLTARYLSAERQAGGVLAIANHAAGFAGRVDLVALLGDPPEDERFVLGHLQPGVRPHLVAQPGQPTVRKRRFVDPFQLSKMFEVQWLGDGELAPEAEDRLLESLKALIPQSDLVIVADFGHGCLGARTIEWLGGQPAYLAVNTQTNSANAGYNLVTKYPRADYVCIDEEEIRLANRSRSPDLMHLLEATARRLRCGTASLTLGSRGSLTYRADTGTAVRTPVFSTEVVDSIGAGDAYLSITSLCAKSGWDPELMGFVGNCVGALAVRIVGNREPVMAEPLFKFISALLH